jgi:hypothetical protein
MENGNMASVDVAAEWVDPASLKPWKRNPRTNDHAVASVAASIKRFGFGAPIVARRTDGEVIAGHTRLKAALQMGLDRVPVRYVDLSPKDARALALVDNRLGELAEWDDDLLDQARLGLEDDVLALLDGPPEDIHSSRTDLEVEAVDVSTLDDAQFWMTVRGPLPKQPRAIAALRKALEALGPDVEVELGGVA